MGAKASVERARCPACGGAVGDPSRLVCPGCGFQPEVPEAWEAGSKEEALFEPAAWTVGRPRRVWLVVVLLVVTLGLYGFYWSYVVFKEVDKQSGQEHETVLYVASLVAMFIPLGGIVFAAYVAKEMGNLQRAKREAGLPEGMGPAGFLVMVGGLFAVSIVLGFGGLFLALAVFDLVGLIAWIAGMFLILLVFTFVPPVVVQRQVNRYWRGLAA